MRPTTYQLGTGIGLLSLTFFFGGLILAFAIRIEGQRVWERFAFPSVLWLSTLLLLLSSWTLEAARYALRRALVAVYRGRLAGTASLAALFLSVQGVAASELLRQGIGTHGNPQASAFYFFMGVHGAHLAGGLVWLGYLYLRAGTLFRASESELRSHRRAASAAAMYWHFMGALWVVLFAFLRRWLA
jgi:cytochrome c oxidase subunit 3